MCNTVRLTKKAALTAASTHNFETSAHSVLAGGVKLFVVLANIHIPAPFLQRQNTTLKQMIILLESYCESLYEATREK